ncbi:MAG: hypothetical protein JW839_20545 [Candidatus Lokiarchaeota archaeon]|nr:hypothetical protein [Candidatus Lokiarchaeota archaeon]
MKTSPCNVVYRQLKTAGEYWAVTRDAEEIMVAPETPKDNDLVCVISDQEGYAKLYSQFIGPMSRANSQPLKIQFPFLAAINSHLYQITKPSPGN